MRTFGRLLAALASGVLLALVALGLRYQTQASVRLEMDDAPAFTSGFYAGERDGTLTFAWTAGRAVTRLASLDRRRAWTCEALIRVVRPSIEAGPVVTLAADGVVTTARPSGGAFTPIRLTVPPSQRAGLTVSLSTTPTFVPGGGDTRELGVQVDSIGCAPDAGLVVPPMPAVRAVAIGSSAFGLAAMGAGLGLAGAALFSGVVGVAASLLVGSGQGPFGAFPDTVAAVVILAAAVGGAVAFASGLRSRSADGHSPVVGSPVGVAVVMSAALWALALAALSHPHKPLIDAVFQAHRFEWVTSGRYFFTQPLPDGVSFPYAIGLFVVASPLATVVADHVLLVRGVSLAAFALGGLAVFWIAGRQGRTRGSALVALALYHAVPLTFVVMGNANLTNVFAQSVAVIAVAATVALAEARRLWRQAAAVMVAAAIVALAFLSHVSTVALLAAMVVSIGAMMAARGGPDGRQAAVRMALVLGLAGVLSFVVYYRHFPEVYERFLTRVTGAEVTQGAVPSSGDPAILTRPLTLGEKLSNSIRLVATDLGWPLGLLAVIGSWRTWRERPRDPASLAAVGWTAAWLTVVLGSTLARVDTAYQRYAAEFVGRANLAGFPAAVLLAGHAIEWAGRPATHRVGRWLAAALVVWALASGVGSWWQWFGVV